MRKLKRFVVCVLTIAMIFSSVSVMAFAQDYIESEFNPDSDVTEIVLNAEKIDETDDATEPEQEHLTEIGTSVIPDNNADDTVAEIHICAIPLGGSFLVGHAWVYIENTSDTEIFVGEYSLSPGEGVSVGTAGIAGGKGPRMYYNLESDIFINSGYVSTKDYITREELEEINEKLPQLDRWDLFFNCTYSAAQIWNIASDNDFIYFVFPVITCFQILVNGIDTAFEMAECDSDDLRVYGEPKE